MPWEGPRATKLPGSRRHGRATVWKIVLPVCAVALGVAVILWHPWRKSAPAAESTGQPATLSEARQLVAKARQLFEKEDDSNRENLLLAEELLRRAEGLDPTDGEVWAAHAQLSGLFISLAYDSGNARHAAVRAQAERAMKLAPQSVESKLAKAWYLTSQTNTLAEGEAVLADLIKRAPNDWRPLRIMGHTVRRLGRFDEGLTYLDRAASFPEGAAVAQVEKATVLFNEGRIPEAEVALEKSLKVRPLGRALLLKVNGLTLWEGNLSTAKQTLEQMPPSLMLEDRGAFLAFRVWLWRREPAKCLAVLNGVSRDFLEDQYFQGPKAFLMAATQKLAGRPDAARPEWEQAFQLIEERLRSNPSHARLLCEKALCLIELGKSAEAEAALRACQQEGKCEMQMWPGGGVAGVLLKLGRPAAAMDEIAAQVAHGTVLYSSRAVLELNPDFDPLKSDPRFQQILSKAPGPTRPAASAVAPDQKSIAVLPFVNMSADKADEYLSDGMTEELLNALTKVKGLRVPGRSSSFAFKGKNEEDIFRKVGEQLHVNAVLEGSVRKAGDKLRITAQLINVADGYHLWSETYDRDMKDILAVQSDVAQRVVQALELQLGVEEARALAKKPTENAEAYRLYLLGRYHFNKFTGVGWTNAIHYFEQALQVDPAYALAYCGLADTYGWAGGQIVAGREAWAKEKELALKALALEPNLADAHLSLGVALFSAMDLHGSEYELKRALELNPNLALAYDQYGWTFMANSRFDEAIASEKKALELDPLNPLLNTDLGFFYHWARRYDEGILQLRKTLELDVNNALAAQTLGWCLHWKGKTVEAIAEFQKATTLDDLPWYKGSLGYAYAASGDRVKAEQILRDLDELAKKQYVSPASRASVYLGLGEKAKALDWIEKAYEDRDPLLWWNADQLYDSVRHEPRFQALMQKVDGLKEGAKR